MDLVGRKHYDEQLDRIQSFLRSFGKSLLLAALDETPFNIKSLFKQLLEKVPKDFESRYRNNIAAVLLGLYLIKQVCKKVGAEFSEVFGLEPTEVKEAIIKAVRDYTMDDGKSKSVIEYTLEIMDRMTPTILKNECHFALHHGGKLLCFNFKAIYDLYTEYLLRHSIDAEKLAYTAFTKQLRKKSYFKDYAAVKLKPELYATKKENYQCFWLDIEQLQEACEIERILTEIGYKPPMQPKPVYKQLKMGDGDDVA